MRTTTWGSFGAVVGILGLLGGCSDGGGESTPGVDGGTLTDAASTEVSPPATTDAARSDALPDAAPADAGVRLPPGSPGSLLVRMRASMTEPCTGTVLEPPGALFGCSATAAYDQKSNVTVVTVADATRVVAAVYVSGMLMNGSYDAMKAMGFGTLILDMKRYTIEAFILDVANVKERTAASMPDQKAYDFAFELQARYKPMP